LPSIIDPTKNNANAPANHQTKNIFETLFRELELSFIVLLGKKNGQEPPFHLHPLELTASLLTRQSFKKPFIHFYEFMENKINKSCAV